MLVVSPVARGHYFMLMSLATCWCRSGSTSRGRTRAAAVMAGIPPALSVSHYAMLPLTGRIGLLGMGTAAWLMAALVLMARADRSSAGLVGAGDIPRRGAGEGGLKRPGYFPLPRQIVIIWAWEADGCRWRH